MANSTLYKQAILCRGVTMNLPDGTVTSLFTDIESSTRHWERQPEAMALVQAHHDALLRNAIEIHGGTVFKTGGDAFCAAFRTAPHRSLFQPATTISP